MSNIPDTGRSRSGLMACASAEALWLAILLVLPLVMNVSLMRTFETSKMGAVAPLAAFGLGVLGAGALGGCFAGIRRVLSSTPVLCFAALLAAAVVATAASETPRIAFFGDYFRREGLLSWLTYGVLFFSLLMALRRREQLDRLIDVLLLSTVVPCVYAVMQRYGYDFFVTHGLLVGTSDARPGGTMGNPVFLASLLLLVIPVTAARLLAPPQPGARAAGDPPLKPYVSLDRGFCLLLLALQVFTVVLSQSRGPGLGLAVALGVFMLLAGGWRRARLPIVIALAAALTVGAALAALNLMPSLGQAVQGTALQRFVYSAADTNISSRVGIWQAGVSAFLDAPWWRQLLGYGPDSAGFTYLRWIPATVQRAEGYTETIDRLHSEFLETAMCLGLLGLVAQASLFASLVWSAAQRLLPIGGTAQRGGFVLLNLAGMALGAALASALGRGAGVAAIGAGAGLAGAWVVFLAWRAWRAVRQPVAAEALGVADGLLIAALAGALVGSWVETLVGVPTIATYAVAAAYAALLVLATRGVWLAGAAAAPAVAAPPRAETQPRKAGKKRAPDMHRATPAAAPAAAYPVLGWAAGLALMIAVTDFFPPLSGARMMPPSLVRFNLIGWPLALCVVAALGLAFIEGRRRGAEPLATLTRFLLGCVPPVLFYVAIYFPLGDGLRDMADAAVADRIALLVELGYAACLLMPMLLAAVLYFTDRTRPQAARGSLGGMAVLAAGALLGSLTYVAVSRDVAADVHLKLSAWAQNQGRPEAALGYAAEARVLVPWERRVATAYAAKLVEAAGAIYPQLGKRPDAAAEMIARLKQAGEVLSEAMRLTPRDPWITHAYANVAHHLATPAFETILGSAERARYSAEARKYLTLAHLQFPGHPWYLRTWVQHEIDQGNRAGAYEKLIEMEQLDPRNITAYPDWVTYAKFGDQARAEAVAAIRRGLLRFPGGSDEASALLEMQIEIARSANQAGQAISAAQEATSTDPTRIRAWRQLAELYELTNQRELALRNAEDAVARFSGRALAGNDAVDFAALEKQVTRLRGPAITAQPAQRPVPAGK